MPRPTGMKKTGGRKKGTPNKITGKVKDVILKIVEECTDTIISDIAILEPKERVAAWLKLVEFIEPKPQRIDLSLDNNKTIKTIEDELRDLAEDNDK